VNIIRHENKIDKTTRSKNMKQSGLVLWFTGLSGSGKSTIAAEVEAELVRLGFVAYLLDGDNLRFGLNANLGFTSADRDENIRRIYEAAALFCDSQMITVVSAISPFKKARELAREKIEKIASDSDSFCEVYIKADVETCKSRDPKGLYAKAIAGEISEFTGISSPYEEPENPDIVIDTRKVSVDEAVKIIITYVLEKELEFLLPKILEDGIYAAFDAGNAIMEIYEKYFKVEYKDDKSPLTEADRKANDIICGRLKKYLPYIDILTEEAADDKKRLDNKFCFIIDPLDGTKEFIKKNGEFTVNIGLAYKNKTVLGIVYAPCFDKLYYAAKNHGAFALDLSGNIFKLCDENTKINVSARVDGLTVMKSRSHGDVKLDSLLEKNKHRIKNEVESGSSLKGCLIAEGIADIYYRFGYTMEWDTCAMQCVVEEAGGVFVQGGSDGSEMLYNRENSLNELGFVILNRGESRLD
jgi:3'(2'), 5'-bisphosphate nucleotidase